MADSAPVTPAQPGPAVVVLPAEIDVANVRQLRQELSSALATGVAVVVADMTATTFCDSMGIRTLFMAHQQARAGSAELRLAIASASVLRVMAVTGADRVLQIYPCLDAALAARPRGNDQEDLGYGLAKPPALPQPSGLSPDPPSGRIGPGLTPGHPSDRRQECTDEDHRQD